MNLERHPQVERPRQQPPIDREVDLFADGIEEVATAAVEALQQDERYASVVEKLRGDEVLASKFRQRLLGLLKDLEKDWKITDPKERVRVQRDLIGIKDAAPAPSGDLRLAFPISRLVRWLPGIIDDLEKAEFDDGQETQQDIPVLPPSEATAPAPAAYDLPAGPLELSPVGAVHDPSEVTGELARQAIGNLLGEIETDQRELYARIEGKIDQIAGGLMSTVAKLGLIWRYCPEYKAAIVAAARQFLLGQVMRAGGLESVDAHVIEGVSHLIRLKTQQIYRAHGSEIDGSVRHADIRGTIVGANPKHLRPTPAKGTPTRRR